MINAIEAIADAGVVTIHTENRPLDKLLQGYEITKEGDCAVLTVSDNGRGTQCPLFFPVTHGDAAQDPMSANPAS
ncbi:MAG: hypothetical protein LLG93_19135 [Deltaproteobacteria bacterium]|nr:hypothetical protein [Deltaproteobacteria bacterium]